jgi:hypothetical protein
MQYPPRAQTAVRTQEPTRLRAALVWIALLGGLLLLTWSKGPVSANPIDHADADGDGLVDAQEQVLSLNQNQADTDGDGYSDLEELARHSQPQMIQSVPLPSTVDLGLTARGDSNRLVVVFAIYLGTLQPSEVQLSMGALLGNRISEIPPWYFMREAWMQLVPAAEPGTSLMVVETSLPPHFVHALGNVTLYGVLEDAQTGAALVADVVDLSSQSGVVFLRASPPVRAAFTQVTGINGGSGGNQPLSGSVYLPIPPGGDGDIPMSWTPGQVCYQKTQIVGAGGGIMTHEVVEAECRDGWDAYCKTDCAGSVGTTYQTLDPAVLVGG